MISRIATITILSSPPRFASSCRPDNSAAATKRRRRRKKLVKNDVMNKNILVSVHLDPTLSEADDREKSLL
jgi:hypothetical protein